MSWLELKLELDKIMGKNTKIMNLPKGLMLPMAKMMESLFPYGTNIPMTQFELEVLSCTSLFDDSKIRKTGFESHFTLAQALQDATR